MRDESVSKSELALLDAGFLVLSRNPGASLADIAAEAGVGRATLHRHFSSRAELVEALARRALFELDAAVQEATAEAGSHWDALRLAMQVVVPLAHRHMFLMQEHVLSPDAQTAIAQSGAELRASIVAAKAEGAIQADIPTEWVAQTYDHLIYAAWDMLRRQEATPKQAADLAWTTFAKGVGA